MSAPAHPPARQLGQTLKNVALILLSLALLPLSTVIVGVTWARQYRRLSAKAESPHNSNGSRTILVTGVGMSKGLTLARLFHQAGHKVIGADFSPQACGGRSLALASFHVLRRPSSGQPEAYLDSVLKLIEHEGVDLWVSCSGVASAVEDGMAKEVVEARTGCRAVQFGVEATRTLHEKGAFMEHTRDVVGLRVPESHLVRSGREMMEVLGNVREKRRRGTGFIAKPVGMNDKGRGDMTLLPLRTIEETKAYVAKLEAMGVSDEDPWLLQEFVSGKEYCTHSLVIRGEVVAFTACASSELLMHYAALPDSSPLTHAMLGFTRKLASSFGDDLTGHLSFDFIVREPEGGAVTPQQVELYPIECNPRAHTAVVLFSDTPALVDAYLSVLADNKKDEERGVRDVITPEQPSRYYWIGHDLIAKALLPIARLILLQTSLTACLRDLKDFITHVSCWRDGTWASWDPLPWWWLYHVYWPLQFWENLSTGTNWSRVNVSTTKMFECE